MKQALRRSGAASAAPHPLLRHIRCCATSAAGIGGAPRAPQRRDKVPELAYH